MICCSLSIVFFFFKYNANARNKCAVQMRYAKCRPISSNETQETEFINVSYRSDDLMHDASFFRALRQADCVVTGAFDNKSVGTLGLYAKKFH